MGTRNGNNRAIHLWENYKKDKTKNKDAFVELHSMYHKDLMAFSVFITKEKAKGEDLAQETWLKMITLSSKIENFKGYLFTIAKNLWFDSRKKRNGFTVVNDKAEKDHARTVSIAQSKINVAHIEHIIQSCLQGKDLKIWSLHCKGLSPSEIAHELSKVKNIAEKTVINRLSMIRKKLRIEVKKHNSNP